MFTLDQTLARDCIVLGDLPLCQLLLMNDSQYPWLILVPRQDGLREICQLNDAQQAQLLHESNLVSRVLLQDFGADKLNVAALGNMVPQLHLHHIARFTHDPAWPKPVWGARPAMPYSAAALAERGALIRRALATAGADLEQVL